MRDIWLQTKVNVYYALVVAILYTATKLKPGPVMVSTSSVQTISSALLSCPCCHKAAGCYLGCCALKLLTNRWCRSKTTVGAVMPDLSSSHAGQQFAESQFLWVVKMKRKAQMTWLMDKFKANTQLCVISFTVWEIISEDFLLWKRIGTYTIMACK